MRNHFPILFTILFLFGSVANAQVATNYVFTDNAGSYTPITGGNVLYSVTFDDQAPVATTIPAFTFDGNPYTTMYVGPNGYLSLGTGWTFSGTYTPISSTLLPPGFISVLGMDLKNADVGTPEISWLQVGNEIVVQWQDVKRYTTTVNTEQISFQARLDIVTGAITFVYGGYLGTSAVTTSGQVGLRGPNNTFSTNVNNRLVSSTGSWVPSLRGTANNSNCSLVIPFNQGDTYIWNLAPNCSGTPTAGTITGPNAVCPNVPFTLSANGNTVAPNMAFQWIVSTNGGTSFSPVGASFSTLTDSLTLPGIYRFVATCPTSGSSDTSAPFNISVNAANLCYCTALNSVTCAPTGNIITNVTISGTTLNNTTTCAMVGSSCYSSFSATGSTTGALQQGATYSLSITTGASSIASVWIDYNQDGVFDATEWTQIYTTGTSGTINITIPLTALTGLTGMRLRTRGLGSPNAGPNACTLFYSGETEDYIITIDTAVSCTGTPLSGSIYGVDSICPSISYTLKDTGYTVASGIAFQWYSSTDSITFNPIGGATNINLKDSATVKTYYYLKATCGTSGAVSTSNTHIVNINSIANCYCNANLGGACAFGGITNVTLVGTTFNNTSGCTLSGSSAYSVYAPTTGTTENLTQGATYTISLTTNATAMTSLWIDYNQNGVFEANEWTRVFLTGTSGTAQFTVPIGAVVGQTRMRVRSRTSGNTNGAANACTNFGSGETEDYVITIIAALPCAGTPSAGLITGVNYICPNKSFTLIDTGSTVGLGISLQWYSSLNGTTFTPIAGATSIFLKDSITANTSYYLIATCANSGATATSPTFLVTVNPPTACYCTPISSNACNSGEYIDSFAINTLVNAHSGCNGQLNGYIDYSGNTAFRTNLTKGNTYTTEIKTGPGTGSHVAGVWIDFNQNGSFQDAGEFTAFPTGILPNSTSNTNVLVPSTALSGLTTLRVRYIFGSTILQTSDCSTNTFSETEDYKVNIINAFSLVNLDSIRNVKCFGGQTGGVFVTPVDTTKTYTYKWSNNATTQDLINVPFGSYTVTVMDATDTLPAGPFVITQTATAVTATKDSIMPASCFGTPTGGIFMTPTGGTAPYTSIWSSGTISEDLLGFAAGSYTDTLRDAFGCKFVSPVYTITQPTQLTIHLDSVVNVTCFGLANGKILTTSSGGTAPYHYAWSNSTALTDDITGLSFNTYTLTTTDSKLCTATASATITQPAQLVVNLDTIIPVACFGDSNGQVKILVSGGTAAYTYLWSNGATTQNAMNLGVTSVSCVVTDLHNCTATSGNYAVTQPTQITATIDSIQTVKCSGGLGGVFISETGGNAPYTFLWSNGIHTEDLTGVPVGAYTCIIKDSKGCMITTPSASITLTAGGIPIVASLDSVKNVTCKSANDGQIYLSAHGGNPPLSYNWTGGTASSTLANLAPGVYVCTITDNSGCSTTKTATIVESALMLTANISTTNQIQNSTKGTATVHPVGGTAPYSYSWANGGTAPTTNNLVAGSYSVTIKDAFGCVFADSVTIGFTSGIAEEELVSNFSLFPNPATDKINIDLNLTETKSVSIQVLNMNGQLLKSEDLGEIKDSKFVLPTNELAEGVYVVQIKIAGNVIHHRVEISH